MNDLPPSGSDRSHRSARFFNYLHRYKNLLKRRWWVLPLTLALGLAVQAYRVWTAPPAFASLGRMIVNVKINTQLGGGPIEEMTQFLGTQVALMRSATVLERARERAKAKANLHPVLVDLAISVQPKTTIFNLQAVGPEPEYTRAYLDAVMEEYIILKDDLRASPAETALAKITEQLANLEREIKQFEAEELAFKTTNDVAFIQEQYTSTANYLVQKNRLLDELRSQHQLLTMFSLEMSLERLDRPDGLLGSGGDRSPGNVPPNVLHSEYLREKQTLELKKAKLAEWSEVRRPLHPEIVAMKEEIAQRERLLEIFKQQGKEQVDSRRDAISIQITNLINEIKELDARSYDLSSKFAQYEYLRDSKQRARTLYDKLFGTMQTIGVEKEINPESVTVLQRATPAMPARANAVKALVVGGVIGLLAGLGILLVVDRLDDRATSFTDLQDMFDEPVLGQIPLESPGRSRNGVPLLHGDDQRHAFLEAYRNLRSSLLYMANEGKRPRTILVTSAIPSDGKSMTAANFAITLALSGSRVVLVDGDLRKGQLHRHFGLASTPGLNEVLTQQAEWRAVVQSTPTANLSVLPRGNTARNPGEMFLSDTSLRLIKELSAEYDYVVLDTAPVMAADDVTSLSPHVEGVLFVIRASYTSARVARAALDLLYQRGVSVLGLVFNGVETNAAEYYYYRYKDYYADSKTA